MLVPIEYDIERIRDPNLAYLAFVANASFGRSSESEVPAISESTLDALIATSTGFSIKFLRNIPQHHQYTLTNGLMRKVTTVFRNGHASNAFVVTEKGRDALERFVYVPKGITPEAPKEEYSDKELPDERPMIPLRSSEEDTQYESPEVLDGKRPGPNYDAIIRGNERLLKTRVGFSADSDDVAQKALAQRREKLSKLNIAGNEPQANQEGLLEVGIEDTLAQMRRNDWIKRQRAKKAEQDRKRNLVNQVLNLFQD